MSGFKLKTTRDVFRLDRAIQKIEAIRQPPQVRAKLPQFPHPAYIAISESQIAACTFADSTWTPGTGTAVIYEIDASGDLSAAGIANETVYNVAQSAISADTPFLVLREFIGGNLVHYGGSGGGSDWFWATLDEDLVYQGQATASLLEYQGVGMGWSDTGNNEEVYDGLLTSGYKLASGTRIAAFQSPQSGAGSGLYFVTAANSCQVEDV